MPYQRPVVEKPKTPHPILAAYQHYEQLSIANDDGWISKELEVLHEDAQFTLGQFLSTVSTAADTDLSIYQPEVQREKRAKPVLQGRQALMTFLKKHVSKADSAVKAVQNAILRVTAPPTPPNEITALRQDMKFKEVRDFLKQTDPKHRLELISSDLGYIQACIDAPTPFIEEASLNEVRRDFAFKQDESLRLQENDQKLVYNATRRRAGEINAIAVKILLNARLEDPLPLREHYDVFPPRTDYERVLANGYIQKEDQKKDTAERAKKFAEKDKGTKLETQARLQRKLRHG